MTPPGSASRYARANTGSDAHRWQTFPDRPIILALARTFTSAVRVLEALAVFRGEHRVRTLFAFDDTSAFNAGTEHLLEELGTGLIPWKDRLAVRPSLVLTATENADMSHFECPVVVLPHGIGFQKYVPDHRTQEVRLSGVPRPEFHRASNIHLVLSHPAQREQLRAARVPLADRAQVIGDPAHDRLLADLRLREQHRERLGVRPHQRLVVTTSTWGPEGLIGTRPALPGALLGVLPHDDYRVAAVLHPNIWFAHSPWQVRHMLADALDSGLLLLPPHHGWGAALVAADCVIGDHGSVTLYGAALDHPMMLATVPGEESVPGTAVSELAKTAPVLEREDLRDQVERAIDAHASGLHRSATDLAFSYRGQGGDRLTAFLYRLLGLPPRVGKDAIGTWRRLPSPEPDPGTNAPLAFEVHGHLDGSEVSLERFPSASREVPEPPVGSVRHLSVYEDEARHALAHAASVVCRAWTDKGRDGLDGWHERTLERYPGAFATAAGTHEGTEVLLRDGRRFLVRTEVEVDPVLSAAALYTLVRRSASVLGEHKVRVGAGRWSIEVQSLTLEPAPSSASASSRARGLPNPR